MLFLKPARAGLILRDPTTRAVLPPEGAEVEDTTFWRRRMQDGDAIEAAPLEELHEESQALPDRSGD